MGDADLRHRVVEAPDIQEWMDESLDQVDQDLNSLYAMHDDLDLRIVQLETQLREYQFFRQFVLAMNYFIIPVILAIGICYTTQGVHLTGSTEATVQCLILVLMYLSNIIGFPLYVTSIWFMIREALTSSYVTRARGSVCITEEGDVDDDAPVSDDDGYNNTNTSGSDASTPSCTTSDSNSNEWRARVCRRLQEMDSTLIDEVSSLKRSDSKEESSFPIEENFRENTPKNVAIEEKGIAKPELTTANISSTHLGALIVEFSQENIANNSIEPSAESINDLKLEPINEIVKEEENDEHQSTKIVGDRNMKEFDTKKKASFTGIKELSFTDEGDALPFEEVLEAMEETFQEFESNSVPISGAIEVDSDTYPPLTDSEIETISMNELQARENLMQV